MKPSNVFNLIFGLFLIAVAIELFQSLSSCKDDIDVALYIIMIICSGFSGACFIAAGIADWNKSN